MASIARTLRGLVLGCASAALLQGAAWAQDDQARVAIDVRAQSLSSALTEFGRQANAEIVFSPDAVRQRDAPHVEGELTTEEALQRLLAGTSLTFRRTRDGVYVVEDPASPTQLGAADAAPSEEEVIVVTGTNIRGAAPVGAPIDVYDEEAIRRTGYSTVGELLRSLPQSYAGGVSPGVVGADGNQNSQNNSAASSANLRGLGSDSTLTLVDGRRLAPSGFSNAVDVSIIPSAAVRRVEVLSDGASSIYGADAVAGVVNFILKDDYEGAETSLRFGGATRGGANEWQASQLVGATWSTGNVVAVYEHLEQDGLLSSERSLSPLTEDPTSLLPSQQIDTLFVSARQDLTSQVELYAQGLVTRRDSQFFETQEGFESSLDAGIEQYGLNAGANISIDNWTLSLNGTASRDNETYDILTFFGGALIDEAHSNFDNELNQIDFVANGPIARLPAGPLMGALGAGYREEEVESPTIPGGGASRDLSFAFGELLVPVLGASEGGPEANISLSTRYENYSDFGSKWTHRVGVDIQPTPSWTYRATWATSFRAPSFRQSYGPRQLFVFPGDFFGLDPTDQVLLQQGANPDLRPETATSWTLGADFQPSDSLRLSVTAFRIDYEDRITQPVTNLGAALSDPTYASLIINSPSVAFQADLIAQSTTFLDFSGGPYDPALVAALIQNQSQNVSAQVAEGVDANLTYTVDLSSSALDFGLAASWLTLENQITPSAPSTEISGFIFNPPNFRVRASVAWRNDAWTIAFAGNYLDDMTDNRTVPESSIDSWFTTDATVAYYFDRDRSSRIQLSIQNLFDEDPPAVDPFSTVIPGLGYDSTNASPLGRFIALSITKTW